MSLHPLEVPAELLVSETEVLKALSAVKIGKAVGPDSIPNKILKEFAVELAPIVQDIFNASLSEGDLLDLLKVSNIYPVPNISPPQQIEKDLRPIALTCTLAKVMEGFVRDRIVAKVSSAIDLHQFARAGHSTTDALVYLLQAICEALHIWNCGGRLFYADFSKGFDMIDHEILISELRYLSVHPVLINCHD